VIRLCSQLVHQDYEDYNPVERILWERGFV
jgi:hypothetical protein